jgi:hypothetical protein
MTNRWVGRTLLLATALLATAGGGGAKAACDTRNAPCSRLFQVPSRLYPTIQSAIDTAPAGSTIQLAAGVYEEAIRIEGKSVTLRGPDPSEGEAIIVGADGRGAAITYARSGGGSIVDVAIHGGASGVAGVRDGGVTPAPIEIKNVSISGTGRGVFGDFSSLSIKDSKISRTAWNGIAVTSASALSLNAIEVFGAVGYGIYLDNTSATLSNVLVHDNVFGGIYIGHSFAEVLGGLAIQNRRAGITIVSSPLVLVQGLAIDNTLPQSDGRFGDGIDVFSSQIVGVLDTYLGYNSRVGIANFGSAVQVGNGTEICCSPIDMELETYAGEAGHFEKVGDVTCSCGGVIHACEAKSGTIGPPDLGDP